MNLNEYLKRCETIKNDYPNLNDKNLLIAIKNYNNKKNEWKKLLSKEDLKKLNDIEIIQQQKQN